MKPTILIISCEHGSNKIPKKYAHLFKHRPSAFNTPDAFDIGAQHLAQHLHKVLKCDLVQTKVSRLLIDCNHSKSKLTQCFSKFTKKLPKADKQLLIDTYYLPFHQELEQKIVEHIAQGYQVLHLSLYTFAPFLNGLFLNTAVGLLYNTHRHGEKEVARIIHGLFQQKTPTYKIRHNFPFLGRHDYVLNSFRKQFSERDYLGIKLGVNQVLITNPHEQRVMCKLMRQTFSELLELL